MTKPYSFLYYITYNGILQTKKFNKVRSYEEKEDCSKKCGILQEKNSPDNKQNKERDRDDKRENKQTYKLNKSKVRGRAIAFTRIPKSKKNLFFYTISFPEKLKDDLCFKVYNIALTRLRKENMINDYLWISERQKNQTLHFHILTNDLFSVYQFNKFIKKTLINLYYKKEFQYDIEVLRKYNGVDIAKNRKTKKVINIAKQKNNKLIVSYLTKYITKNNEKFTRLPFHSSHSISKLTNKVLIDQYEADIIWHKYQQNNLTPKIFKNDFCTLHFFSNDVEQEVFEIIDKQNIQRYRGSTFEN